MDDFAIQTKHLSKTFGKGKKAVEAVIDLNLEVKAGQVFGFLGPNGAGKTTTFYMMTGMVPHEEGELFLDGQYIGGLPMYKRALMGLSYLPQEPSIFRKLTVRQNIQAVLEIRGIPANEHEVIIENILEEYDLKDFAERQGVRLSGGQRRRTEIARAIATHPKFILFDEPFAGIDPIAIVELKKMLQYLRDRGLGILITDHNVRDTLSITDRAYILSDGAILDHGVPEKLVANPEVKNAYLGEEFSL
ncbi:MAG: LPS export ABC transporter ATP-binding protein [Thermodesulfovibrionales bacterium]|nr:LPS export ABC transporter ATP-binding protein [Thermodesulfovibrionales bacterium]